MTKVFVAKHPTEAHLVAGLLTTHGIEAQVRGEALFSVRGEVPVAGSTLPSVWVVDDSQITQALDLLKTDARAVGGDRPWTCVQCGESVDAQFQQCWNCGSPIPIYFL